jgi:hypothetical protein
MTILPMQTPILALCGEAHHGKDSVADHLADQLQKREIGVARIAFGDALKRHLHALFAFTYEELWGANKELPAETPLRGSRYVLGAAGLAMERVGDHEKAVMRHAAQTMGEAARQVSEDVWCERWLDAARALDADPDRLRYEACIGVEARPAGCAPPAPLGLILCTDVRHPNELALMRLLGARIWRVTRPAEDAMQGRDPRWADHPSEALQRRFCREDFDVTLYNGATLCALQDTALRTYHRDLSAAVNRRAEAVEQARAAR